MSIEQGDHQHPGMQHPGMETEELGYYARRVAAIEAVLAEKGFLSRAKVQQNIDVVESRSPADGARVVARAWSIPSFENGSSPTPMGP